MQEIINTRTATKKTVIAEGGNYKTALFVIDKEKGIHDHKTEGFGLLQVLSGAVTLTQAGKKTYLQKEDFLSFNAALPHSITADTRSRIIMTVIKS